MSNKKINFKDVEAVNAHIAIAEKAKDAAFFQAILSPNLIFRRANGTVASKTDFIAGLTTKDFEKLQAKARKVVYSKDHKFAYLYTKVDAIVVKADGSKVAGQYANHRHFVCNVEDNTWQLEYWINFQI